eukprot:jgi/Psemu1/5954/gm1.5954_g
MPSPPALSFPPNLTLPRKDNDKGGPQGGGGMAGEHLGTPNTKGELFRGEGGILLGICVLSPDQQATLYMGTTKFNLEHSAALAPDTYLFIEIKPGHSQRHFASFTVFRTVFTGLEDPTRDKALSPANVQDLNARTKAKQAKLDHIKREATKGILNPSYPKPNEGGRTRPVLWQQNGNHADILMEPNVKFTGSLCKLKAQSTALAKDKRDKVTQLFNYYFSPDLSKLSLGIHTETFCWTGSPGLNQHHKTLLAHAGAIWIHLPIAHSPCKIGQHGRFASLIGRLGDSAIHLFQGREQHYRGTPGKHLLPILNRHGSLVHLTHKQLGWLFACREPHSLLPITFNSKAGSNNDVSFESSTRKSGYNSPKTALVMKSFWCEVPEVFTGGKISSDFMILLAIPLWTSFEGEGSADGFRYKLQTRLNNVVETIRQEEAVMNISMEGLALAQTCIQDAKTFTSELFQWMCQTHQDLQKSNPSSSNPSHKAQKAGAKLGADQSVIMCGCLHGRQAALEFKQDDFSNYPVVQTVLNEPMRHRAIMQDEMNTHLAALKKEQEAFMKELCSLKVPACAHAWPTVYSERVWRSCWKKAPNQSEWSLKPIPPGCGTWVHANAL